MDSGLNLAFQQLIYEKMAVCILLGNIDRESLHEHICHLLDCTAVSEELLNVVEKRAGGNFLYVQEFIGSMGDAGILVREGGGRVTIESEDTLAVPDKIEALISSRVDSLFPSQQYLIRTAAAIGKEFRLEMLVAVHPNTDMLSTLERDMKELVRKRFLEFVGDEKETLRFCHTYVQEAVYMSALVDTNKQIHRSCAQYFEIYYVDDLSPHFGSIAKHYKLAQQFQQAAHYSILASEFALSNNMYESTIEFVDIAMEIVQKMGRRYKPSNRFKTSSRELAHLHFQAGTARFATGNLQASIFHYEQCIRMNGHLVLNRNPAMYIERVMNKAQVLLMANRKVQHGVVSDALALTDESMDHNSMVSQAFLNLASLYHMQNESYHKNHVSCLMKAARYATKEGTSTKSLIKVLCGLANIGITLKWNSIVDYCIHECGRLSTELDATDCFGMYSCVKALRYTFQGDLGMAKEKFEIGWDLCWEERQLDWWSMALIGNAFTDFEVGEGWDCLSLIKDEMSRAIATRNFFIFERICVFLLPYLWEMDTEIEADGTINPDGDCYEEWVDYFVDQSAVLSNESVNDKTRNSFRYFIGSDGHLVCAAGVLREINLGFFASSAEWALQLSKSYEHWPQDSIETLLMSLPTYQLVAALLTLHKEQSRKVKGNAQKELDNYPQGCFTSAAEGIVTAFEQNVIAVVSKPWALMCRALLHKAHNRLEKCVDKLTDALRIASHHSMQSCMGYIYMNLSQTEKLLSSNKMINDVHASIAGAQRNQPEKGQRMSTAMVTKKGRGGRRKAAVAVAKEAVDLIYMSHARSALDIAERCGLTHVYFSCLKLLDSKASQFGSFRRLSGRQSFMPDTVNHDGGRRRIEALHDQRLGSVVDSGRGDHHASIFDGAANRGFGFVRASLVDAHGRGNTRGTSFHRGQDSTHVHQETLVDVRGVSHNNSLAPNRHVHRNSTKMQAGGDGPGNKFHALPPGIIESAIEEGEDEDRTSFMVSTQKSIGADVGLTTVGEDGGRSEVDRSPSFSSELSTFRRGKLQRGMSSKQNNRPKMSPALKQLSQKVLTSKRGEEMKEYVRMEQGE
jgi:tetratricopeptide (TPR) repeat protein